MFCVACGAKVAVPPGRAGSRLACPGCGKVLSPVPGDALTDPPPGITFDTDSAPHHAANGAADHVGFDFQQLSNPEASAAKLPPANAPSAAQRLPATRGRPSRASLLTLAVAALMAAGGVVLGLRSRSLTTASPPNPAPPPAAIVNPSDAWEKSTAADLVTQKQSADRMALAGQLQQAYDAYASLLQTIAGHAARDPLILNIATGARSAQDQVFAALLRKRTLATQAPASQPGDVESAAAEPAQSSAPSFAAVPAPAPQPLAAAALEPVEPPTDGPGTPPPTAPAEPPTAARPPVALRTYYAPAAVTDEQIGQAIHRGVMFLQRAFRNGQLQSGSGGYNDLQHWAGAYSTAGVDALCVYALLHAGQANDEKWLAADAPFTSQMLERLKAYDYRATYHRSLRAAALAVYHRPADYAALEADVNWLVDSARDGAYTYLAQAGSGGQSTPLYLQGYPTWDNSNSQYGLLGVWAGAAAGVSVPDNYWIAVERHWNTCQLPDGQWGYLSGEAGRLTMTDAGVASLLVTRDYLDHPRRYAGSMLDTGIDHRGGSAALQRGLDWLDQGDNAIPSQDVDWLGYALYGVERVGLASGYKYFGIHDWYSEIAKRLVVTQHGDGAWGTMPPTLDTAISTAYSLLFLSRGRHPILFNKLRFNGYWDNHRHDLENLAAFATHEIERPINWQVVNLGHDWPDWMDSPVLYIASDEAPRLTQHDQDNIRNFALGGGLIYTQADGAGTAFNNWARQLAGRLFPQFPLQVLPASHPVYSVLYPLQPGPALWGVSNGSRLLMVHSPADLAAAWEVRWSQSGKLAYQMGLNLFLYAAGKGNLRNRVESPYVPQWDGVLEHSISVARLRYDGNWDPEPYAWTRLDRYLAWETQRGLGVKQVDLSALAPGTFPLADLTGTASHQFTDDEVAAVRAYVAAGGVLLVDACGGQTAFADDVRGGLLARAFPGASLQPMPPSHPMLQATRPGADDLANLTLRPYAMQLVGPDVKLQMLSFGKGVVVFSPLDFTTGLLGTNTWGVVGYDPAYAAALVKNVILWADARAVGRPASVPAP
jgi:hypothetical protein